MNRSNYMDLCWLLHLILVLPLCMSQSDECSFRDYISTCVDLMPESDVETCWGQQGDQYVYCNFMVPDVVQGKVPGPKCPDEELDQKNWSGCQRGDRYEKYEMSIQPMYFDIVCCPNRKCGPCEEEMVKALCYGMKCSFAFVLIDPRNGNKMRWDAARETHASSDFEKKTLHVNVDSSKVKLQVLVGTTMDVTDIPDEIINDSMYLQPIYSCKNGDFVINGDWLEHRDNKAFCHTQFYALEYTTMKDLMDKHWYKRARAEKMDILVRTMWTQTIVRHETVTKR